MDTEKEYRVSRAVTKEECPWLDEAVAEGTRVFDYSGVTYGCIRAGKAVTRERGETPFFELPRDALEAA
ncbi:MAG TPA: hypothetical protein VMF90_21825 [Rhizobiaceae bacterium]|nr:hypothetical protein [Rhizobiaceae bacterium]